MGALVLSEQAAPGTPASGDAILYPKTDGLLYWKDDAGAEHQVESTLVLLGTATASASSSIDFTSGLSSTYNEYLLKITDLVVGTNGDNLYLRVSEDGGSTYKSGASDYAYTLQSSNDASATANSGSTGAAFLAIGLALSSTKSYRADITFSAPSGASRHKVFTAHIAYEANGTTTTWGSLAGIYKGTNNAINALRIIASSGTIASGNFALYGYKKA